MIDPAREIKLRIRNIKKKYPNKLRVFTISSTAKIEDSSYLTPVRSSKKIVIIGIVVFKLKDIDSIKKIINENFNYIFLDNDLKRLKNSTKNIYDLYANYFNPKKIMAYKPNDITVDACWSWIYNNTCTKKTNVLIVGMGNIGTKLSLKLYESGKNIYVTRKNHKKGAENVKLIKKFSNKNYGFIKYVKNIKGIISKVNLIILCANKNAVLNYDIAKKIKKNSTIIDLGKNNLTSEAIKFTEKNMIKSYRLDIGTYLLSHIESSIELKKNKLYGRKKYKKFNLISGGYIGSENDVVVDNYKDPKFVLGIANGTGDFKTRTNNLSRSFLKQILHKHKKNEETKT